MYSLLAPVFRRFNSCDVPKSTMKPWLVLSSKFKLKLIVYEFQAS